MTATRDSVYTEILGPNRQITAVLKRNYRLDCGHTVPKVKHRNAIDRQVGDEFRCSACRKRSPR